MCDLIKKSLSIQIYEYLKDEIVLQKIHSGTKLTIKDIQEKYSVSSTPVRDALSLLAKEGLVDIVVNQGATVCNFDLKTSLEIHELHYMLDIYVAKKALNCGKNNEIAMKLKAVIDSHIKSPETASVKEKVEFDTDFHKVFYEYINNQDIINIKNLYYSKLQIITVQAFKHLSCDRRIKEHLKIYEAVKNNQTEEAIIQLKKHYNNGALNIKKFFADKKG